jgi:hypothetical protein
MWVDLLLKLLSLLLLHESCCLYTPYYVSGKTSLLHPPPPLLSLFVFPARCVECECIFKTFFLIIFTQATRKTVTPRLSIHFVIRDDCLSIVASPLKCWCCMRCYCNIFGLKKRKLHVVRGEGKTTCVYKLLVKNALKSRQVIKTFYPEWNWVWNELVGNDYLFN